MCEAINFITFLHEKIFNLKVHLVQSLLLHWDRRGVRLHLDPHRLLLGCHHHDHGDMYFFFRKRTRCPPILLFIYGIVMDFSRCVFSSWFFSAEYKSKVFSRWVLFGVLFFVCFSWCVFLGVFFLVFLSMCVFLGVFLLVRFTFLLVCSSWSVF